MVCGELCEALGISAAMVTWFILGFIVLVVWSAVWKGIALWKSGRNNQLVWFIVLFILNTAGILEIIYLLAFQKRK